MKKVRVFILALAMFIGVLFPTAGLAGIDEDLEKVLVMARQKFDIPQDLEFTYSVYTRDGKQLWNLRWYDKEKNDKSLDISIMEDGTVVSYYQYKWKEYKGKRIPLISEEEARIKAEEFIERINPGILKKVQRIDNKYSYSFGNTTHYFRYVRMENGIPYYNDFIQINVDNTTGEINSYQFEWSNNVKFPEPKNIINMEKAQEAYIRDLGLDLVYMHYIDNEEIKIFPVYTPIYSNDYVINAFTGEKIKLNENIVITFDERLYGNTVEKAMLQDAAGENGIVLSPEEVAAIEQGAKFLTQKEAEKVVRNNTLLEVSDDMRLGYSSFTKVYYSDDEYRWNLSFTNKEEGRDSYDYARVVLDAETGEILGYSKYSWSASDTTTVEKEPVYNREQARQKVEEYLNKLNPEKFSKTEYMERYNGTAVDKTRYQKFIYTRKVFDVPFPGNDIIITYDCVEGKVIEFSITWFNAFFPSVRNAIGFEKAYDSLFDEIGLELQYYRPMYFQIYLSPDAKISGGVATPEVKYEAKLVYLLKTDKPWYIDAFTGSVVNYDGSVYETKLPVQYQDIEDSYAKEEIEILARYGISLKGDKFYPKSNITQWDFFSYLAPALDNYYGPIIPLREATDDKSKNELYNFLTREGIITEEEWSPESNVTREDAVKYIIRALKYENIAKFSHIFKVGFKDQGEISEGLLGHVAIASGLNIINGKTERFRPKDFLTREETAVMIYNLLKRD